MIKQEVNMNFLRVESYGNNPVIVLEESKFIFFKEEVKYAGVEDQKGELLWFRLPNYEPLPLKFNNKLDNLYRFMLKSKDVKHG